MSEGRNGNGRDRGSARIVISPPLYHRYTIDETGLILSSKIVPPTARNLKRIEDELWRYLPRVIWERWDAPVEEIAWRGEQAIRNYGPCISCATHYPRVRAAREE